MAATVSASHHSLDVALNSVQSDVPHEDPKSFLSGEFGVFEK